MKHMILLIALFLSLFFVGCEVTVSDDYSSYEDRIYKTDNYYYSLDCDLFYHTGDVRDVKSNSCSRLSPTSYAYAYDFSPSRVVEYYGRSEQTYRVYEVYAFSYQGDIYITYDVGDGIIFEYNYTRDEVGVYYDSVVTYYTN